MGQTTEAAEQTSGNECTWDGLMRVDEAAAFLSCSRSMLYELMRTGALPFVRIGRGRRIPRRALRCFAARHLAR